MFKPFHLAIFLIIISSYYFHIQKEKKTMVKKSAPETKQIGTVQNPFWTANKNQRNTKAEKRQKINEFMKRARYTQYIPYALNEIPQITKKKYNKTQY